MVRTAIALGLAGAVSAPAHAARLCVAGSLWVQGDTVQVMVDELPLGVLSPGQFVCLDVEDGPHALRIDQLPRDPTCAHAAIDGSCIDWTPREGSASETLRLVAGAEPRGVQLEIEEGHYAPRPMSPRKMAQGLQRNRPAVADRLKTARAPNYEAIARYEGGPPAASWKVAAQLQAVRGYTEPIDRETALVADRCLDRFTVAALTRAARLAPVDAPLGLALHEAGVDCAPSEAQRAVLDAAEAETARIAALPREPLVDALRRALQDSAPGPDARALAGVLVSVSEPRWDLESTAALVQLCLDAGLESAALFDASSGARGPDAAAGFADAGLACGVELRILDAAASP